MSDRMRVVVTGAGGFIGHHLVKALKRAGHWVRGVDIKEPVYEATAADEFRLHDLRRYDEALDALRGADRVFHLAANMGGIEFIESYRGIIARDNTFIDMHTLESARLNGVQRLLYTSSACVYPDYRQCTADVTPLSEDDAYPAAPEDGYGWQKLYTERLCRHYREDFGLDTRIVRFHNIFGPLGTYDGGREKAPAAICRKVALADDNDEIEVWGDGAQTRSFCYIDDCVEGLMRLMDSDYVNPLNLGQDRLITINELVDMVCGIAGKRLRIRHELDRPLGVRGRNSDNSRLREVLRWEPRISLEDGMARTYEWIRDELVREGRLRAAEMSVGR